jgi:hypothetical protein
VLAPLFRLAAYSRPNAEPVVAVTPHADPDASRCFTLEHSWTLDGQPATVLAEWTAAGHVNYGDGPPPEQQAFLTALGLLAP